MYEFVDKLKPNAVICIDVDRTLIAGEPATDAEQLPINNRVELVEQLCKRGFRVFYWTGRPSSIENLTRYQLTKVGFRDLPIVHAYKGDLMIDDKAINEADFEKVIKKLIEDNPIVCM